MQVSLPERSRVDERTPILSGERSKCCSGGILKRKILAILGCLGFMNVYAMRVNLSVALVAMVKKIPVTSDGAETVLVCSELLFTGNSTSSLAPTPLLSATRGEFDWDPKTQAWVLGSFFMGYVTTQIPGGILAKKIGPKRLFFIGILITSIFTLLTPVAARWNVTALFIVRFIEGVGEGVTFPAMNDLIGRWVPKLERSRISTFIYIGSPIGTVLAQTISGFLCSSDFFGGWPSVFYFFGTLGCIWSVFWMLLIYDSPEEHPTISKEELRQICNDRGETRLDGPIPWKAILLSRPVWALIITHFGQNWGFYLMLTELPTYLSNVLHFDIKKNGVLSSLPYVAQAIFSIIASHSSDYLRRKSYNNTSIRKYMNSIAFFTPALCIFLIPFVGCEPVIIMLLIILGLGFNGFMYSGFNVTHVDMSPEFAGILMGITNMVANFAGFLAPGFVGKITGTGHTLENWSLIFFTTTAVYCVTAIIFIMFGSAEPQPWGTSTESKRLNVGNDDNTPTSVILHRSSHF